VVKTGSGVTEFAQGDHVALSYASCGLCPACRAGRPYHCEHYGAYFDGWRPDGSTPLSQTASPWRLFCQGGFAQFATVGKRSANKDRPRH
jgi:aryl-alcohol dehydrogenase